jgi:hypothetical protein
MPMANFSVVVIRHAVLNPLRVNLAPSPEIAVLVR